MKINKTRRRNNGTISRRKYKNIHKSRKQIKRTHKKSLLRLKKYNKNNRHRRHYTRKVNRSRRGGVPLLQISEAFNFSFPDDNQDKTLIAAGWGYVTKISSVFSQKNRPEQLIVYKKKDSDQIYIARCTFSDCKIIKGGITENNMEDDIKVDSIEVTAESDSSLFAKVKSSDNRVYIIRPGNTQNDDISINNPSIKIPNLYKYFLTFIIEFLQNFRMNPELFGKIYDVVLDPTRTMVINLITKHIFPLETLVTTDDSKKSGEKQFSKVLYYIWYFELIKTNNIQDVLRADTRLYNTLFRLYVEKYKVDEAIGLTGFLDTITEQSDIDESVEEIIKRVNLKMNDLPIGVKCVFKAIKDGFDVLDKRENRGQLMMTWDTQCLNVLYLRIIVPYIVSYKLTNNPISGNSGPSKLQQIYTKLMRVVSKPNFDTTEIMKAVVNESIDIIEKMELNCDKSDIDIEFLKRLPYGNVNLKDCDDFIKLCKTKGIEFPAASQPT
jgi:hypothetical protein